MADLEKTIDIIFGAKDNVSTSLKKMQRNIKGFQKKTESISEPFVDATEKVTILSAAITAMALAGVKAASDIETAMNKAQSQLGLSAQEANNFQETAIAVYQSGFGEDLASAFEAATNAQRRFGNESQENIVAITKDALKLQEIFGEDYANVLSGVSTLTKEFGVSSKEAFDFITAGFQKGLNASGDFIDSINEYGLQFSSGGANAAQFFSILETGFVEGTLGSDKAADAFKEFTLKIQDDSKGTQEALAKIGIDSNKLRVNLNSGKTSFIEAFDVILKKLQSTQGQLEQNALGAEIIGTQYEDLKNIALNLDIGQTAFEDLQGKIDAINIETFEKKIKEASRIIESSFATSQAWDDIKDVIGDLVLDVAKNFDVAFDKIDFSSLTDKIGEAWDTVAAIFEGADLDLTTVDGMENALVLVRESLESLIDISKGIIKFFSPVADVVITLVKAFNALPAPIKEDILVFGLLGKTLSVLAANPVFAVFAIGGAAWNIGTWARETFPSIDKVTQSFFKLIDKFINFSGQAGDVDLGFNKISKNASDSDKKIKDVSESIKQLTFEISKETEGYELYIEPKIDKNKIKETAKQGIVEYKKTWDGIEDVRVFVDVTTGGTVEKAKKEIKEIPTEKQIEIELKGDIEKEVARVNAQAKTLQSAFEYKAKVDVAKAQAAAEKLKAAFESINTTINSTGSTISALFDNIQGAKSQLQERKIENQIDRENKLRERAVEMQEKLLRSQIEINEEKANKLRAGDLESTITVQAEGLQPALEMIFHEILKMCQIRANAEGAELLLGV